MGEVILGSFLSLEFSRAAAVAGISHPLLTDKLGNERFQNVLVRPLSKVGVLSQKLLSV